MKYTADLTPWGLNAETANEHGGHVPPNRFEGSRFEESRAIQHRHVMETADNRTLLWIESPADAGMAHEDMLKMVR